MNRFEHPTPEGAKEVAAALGISVDEILQQGQDWQYTFPSLSDLSRYEEIYRADGTSDLAKRVLGCFIFECMEDHLREGGAEDVVRSSLSRLAEDYQLHGEEFRYWSLMDDGHYEGRPEDGWRIMNIVREYRNQAEQGGAGDAAAAVDSKLK